jgi:hypothetical protein
MSDKVKHLGTGGLRILDPDSALGEVASSREGDGCLLS